MSSIDAQTVVPLDPGRYERWDLWFDTSRWKRRAKRQLWARPMCENCLAEGRVVRAEHVMHVRRHNGERAAFIGGELMSLCRDCHGRKWMGDYRDYSDAVGVDGYPLDPCHPFMRRG
jgi:hypothetical protein